MKSKSTETTWFVSNGRKRRTLTPCRRRLPWRDRGSSKEPRKLSGNLKHARNAPLAREKVPEFRLPAPPPLMAPCFEATKVQDDLLSERFHRPQACPRN